MPIFRKGRGREGGGYRTRVGAYILRGEEEEEEEEKEFLEEEEDHNTQKETQKIQKKKGKKSPIFLHKK